MSRPKDHTQNIDIEELVDAPKLLVDMALQLAETDVIATSSDPLLQRFQSSAQFSSEAQIKALLKEAKTYVSGSQPALALMPITSTISAAKRLGYGGLVEAAQVSLAEVLGLHLGMPAKAVKLLERYLPGCLTSEDVEHRAYSQWTYARLLLACSQHKTAVEMNRCLHWMTLAEQGKC